jgi:hypothetical protein
MRGFGGAMATPSQNRMEDLNAKVCKEAIICKGTIDCEGDKASPTVC